MAGNYVNFSFSSPTSLEITIPNHVTSYDIRGTLSVINDGLAISNNKRLNVSVTRSISWLTPENVPTLLHQVGSSDVYNFSAFVTGLSEGQNLVTISYFDSRNNGRSVTITINREYTFEDQEKDRITRVWAVIEDKEFEIMYLSSVEQKWDLQVPAMDVWDPNHIDDIYRVFLHAKDWAGNEAVVDSYDPVYGRFLEIQITEAIEYDLMEEDPLIPPMMGWLMDEHYNPIRIIDSYESFIWTERFNSPGDFELYLPMDKELYDDLFLGYYLGLGTWVRDPKYPKMITNLGLESEYFMVIETVTLTIDSEKGKHIEVKGRSLESILDRRIVWDRLKFDKKPLEEALEQIIKDNIISAKMKDRRIPDFIFTKSGDKKIEKLTLSVQYRGDNILELIEQVCKSEDIGFKLLPYKEGGFEFQLYSGIDRSYDQSDIPWVIFSPQFENLSSSKFYRDETSSKTVALIKAEKLDYVDEEGNTEENEDDKYNFVEYVSDTSKSKGLARREIYMDDRIMYEVESEEEDAKLTDDERQEKYDKQIQGAGKEFLVGYKSVELFEGDIEPVRQFIYGTDFLMGDIVQIEDEYSMKLKRRMIELIRSHDQNGIKITPSFGELLEKKEEENNSNK